MKLDFLNQLTLWHFISLLYSLYACFQVFKWIFKAIRTISDWSEIIVYKLTPKSVLEKRKQKIHQQRIDLRNQQKIEKQKLHREALEHHRKYQSVWINLGFIEEDRATLFKGYEDIKWLWGCHRIKDPKKFSPFEAHEIARFMFIEICAYRWEFKKQPSKWTNEMEVFFKKIMPKKYLPEKIDFDSKQFKKAEADFDSDKPAKASA